MIGINNIGEYTCVEIEFNERFYYFALKNKCCSDKELISTLQQFNYDKYPRIKEKMTNQPTGGLYCYVSDEFLESIINNGCYKMMTCLFDFENIPYLEPNSLIRCCINYGDHAINIALNNEEKLMMVLPDEEYKFKSFLTLCLPVFTSSYKQFRTDLKLFLLSKIPKLEFVS